MKPTLMIAGASGQLGRAAAERLTLRCGDRLILGSRSPDRLADFADRVQGVRRIDFDDPDSLATGFAGVDHLLMISTNDLAEGRRAAQHRSAIEAAKSAGVRHIVYTSVTRPEPGALLSLSPEHFATEQMLRDSGLAWTILRNNCYLDFALMGLLPAIAPGVIDSAAGDGKVGYVSRDDCAAAAASALESAADDDRLFDITGPVALTMAELISIAAAIAGKSIAVNPVSADQLREKMAGLGFPPILTELVVSTDLAAAKGQLAVVSDDLAMLTGHAPTDAKSFFRTHAQLLAGAAR